ncbi:NAD-dependent epimerase/dehydratase family protein [Pseudomonas sp. CM25]|uniref:NAD-dependent epimerase/dehydratase family protein n=1 Tax=Pseudomonas sp. CM25 TaxID=2738448 RepID=UPI001557BC96|nr:NAD-dependent epimerase/dehydratase family protein [Pseudomonas sp. CM25]NQD56562.1 NAD-dependent epimerase/dehydratase family protein [Pseudomonas sp. CM25]
MRVMVTGAAGFVGRLLVERLLKQGSLRGQSIDILVLIDHCLDNIPDDPRVRLVSGSITEPSLLRRSLADGIDVVFHLVSVAGGAAEKNYSLGRQVNLMASLELLSQLRDSVKPPVIVYASSVAVYGGGLPVKMDEGYVPRPALAYGAHKLMVETELNDLSRRGEIDGRALRLPGIVARPSEPNGLRSAFMSDLMQRLAAGEQYECPVSPEASAWWMSAACCVDNLLHAAQINVTSSDSPRIWQLPVLHLSVGQVAEALFKILGNDRRHLLSYRPEPDLETLFGRYPPIRTPLARERGFRNDISATNLVRNSLGYARR